MDWTDYLQLSTWLFLLGYFGWAWRPKKLLKRSRENWHRLFRGGPAWTPGVFADTGQIPIFRDGRHLFSCFRTSWPQRVALLITGRLWIYAPDPRTGHIRVVPPDQTAAYLLSLPLSLN